MKLYFLQSMINVIKGRKVSNLHKFSQFIALFTRYFTIYSGLFIMHGYSSTPAVPTYVNYIKQIENATSRISWSLNNFYNNSNHFLQDPATAATTLRQIHAFLESSTSSSKSFLTRLDEVSQTCQNIYSIITPNRLLENGSFQEQIRVLSQQLLEMANSLHQEYCQYFATPASNASLIPLSFQEDKIEDLSIYLPKIAENISNASNTFTPLLNAIIDVKNHDLIDTVKNINPKISTLNQKITNIYNRLNTAQYFTPYSNTLDTVTRSSLQSIIQSTQKMSFDLSHEMNAAECADISSTLESITSTISTQLQQISALKTFAKPDDSNKTKYITNINNISSTIYNITSKIKSISQMIQSPTKCILNNDFINHMRDIEKEATTCLNCLQNISPVKPVELPKANIHYTFSQIPYLYERIYKDVADMQKPLELILEKFQKPESYNQDVGVAIQILNNNFISLDKAFFSESQNSLIQVLEQDQYDICYHNNIKIALTKSIQNIHIALSTFPIINMEMCCSPLFAPFKDIQKNCAQIFRYLEAFQAEDSVYNWNAHPHWKTILHAINNFLKTLKLSSPILKNEDLPDKCQHNLILPHISLIQNGLENVCTSIKNTLEAANVKCFSPIESIDDKNLGCTSIATFLMDIQNSIENMDTIFPNIEIKFLQSDYALDIELKNLLAETSQNLDLVIAQIGRTIPKLTDLCPLCKKISQFRPNNTIPQGSDVLDQISKGATVISNDCKKWTKLLETPFCCRKPYQRITEINSYLNQIASFWRQLTNQPLCYLPSLDPIIPSLEQTADAVNKISVHIQNMWEIVNRPLSDLSSHCLLYNFLPDLEHIQEHINNLNENTFKFVQVFCPNVQNTKPSNTFLESEFCNNSKQVLSRFLSYCKQISTYLSTFNNLLNQRDVIRYSPDLDKYMHQIKNNFDAIDTGTTSLISQIAAVANNFACCDHSNPALKDDIHIISQTVTDTYHRLESMCCSYLAQNAYETDTNLKIILQFFDILFNEYQPDTLLGDILPYIKEFSSSLPKIQNLIENLQEDIQNVTDINPDNYCLVASLANHWTPFNHELSSIFSTLQNILHNSSSFPPASQAPPSSFNCETLQKMIVAIVDDLSTFSTKLSNITKAFRANPPFYADDLSILQAVSMAKNLFSTLCNLLKFFELSDTLGNSRCSTLCKKCKSQTYTIQNGILSNLEQIFNQNFDDLYDILSKPGCCVAISDDFLELSNNLLTIQDMNDAFGQLTEISLKTSEDQFIPLLTNLDSALHSLELAVQELADFKLPDIGQNRCPNQYFRPFIQKISQTVQAIQIPLLQAYQFFGSIPNTTHPSIPNRSISGCESMSLAIKEINNSTRKLFSNWVKIIEVVRQPDIRPYYPNMISCLQTIFSQLRRMAANFTIICNRFNERPACLYCSENGFKKEISQNLNSFHLIFEKLTARLENDDSESFLGTLKRYCCSESNIILQKSAEEFESIQYLIQNMMENPQILDTTFDSAIIHQLIPIQQNLKSLSEAIMQYQAAVEATPAHHYCKIAANIHALQDIYQALIPFKHCILNFTNFTKTKSTIPFIPEPTPQQPHYKDDTFTTVKRINNAMQNINKSLSVNIISRLYDLTYAHNQDIIDFFQWFRTQDLDAPFIRIYQQNPCPYCSFDIDLSITNIHKSLALMESHFKHPTCCRNVRNVLNRIEAQSKSIIAMGNLILNRDDKSDLEMDLSQSNLIDLLIQSMNTLRASSQEFATQLSLLPKNTPCILKELQKPITTLNLFTQKMRANVQDILFMFTGTPWFSSDSYVEHDENNNCQDIGFQYFCSALENAASISFDIANIVNQQTVVIYFPELPFKLQTIIDDLAASTNTFGALSNQFATFTECSACQAQEISYATHMSAIETYVNTLHHSISNIANNINQKCCSLCFEAVNELAYQLQRIGAYFYKIVYDNPVFVAYFFKIEGPYPILTQLNDNSNQTGLEQIIAYLEQSNDLFYQFNLNERAYKEAAFKCLSASLVEPLMIPLISACTAIGDSFRDAYLTQYNNGDMQEPRYQKLPDYSCHSSVISVLMGAFDTIIDCVNHLNRLQNTNSYSITGKLLLPTVSITIQHLNTMINILQELEELPSIVICRNCASIDMIFKALKTKCIQIRDALMEIQIRLKEIKCCRNFTQLADLCKQQLDYFALQNAYLLEETEKSFLHHDQLIVSNDTIYNLLTTLNDSTPIICQIEKEFECMNEKLENAVVQPSKISEHCFSTNCLPDLLYIYTKLEDLNRSIKLHLSKNYCTYGSSLDIVRMEEEDCKHRVQNMHHIVEIFNHILNSWSHFADVFHHIDLTMRNKKLNQNLDQFSEAIIKLHKNFIDWGNNNSLITIEQVVTKPGEADEVIEKTVNKFCMKCAPETFIADEIQHIKPEDKIHEIFNAIQSYPIVQPTYFAQRELDILQKNIHKTAGMLSILCQAPDFIILLSQDAISPFWEDFHRIVQAFIPPLSQLLSDSENSNALSIFQLHSLFQTINSNFGNLAKLFKRIYENLGISLDDRYMTDAVSFIPQDNADAMFTQFIHQFKIFSSAWKILCNTINTDTEDEYRELLANIFDEIHESFKTIYSNILFEEIFSVMNPSNASKTVPVTARNIMTHIIQNTEILVRSLWMNNCCDAHVSCIYTILQHMQQIQDIIPNIQSNNTIQKTLTYFTNTWITLNNILQSIYKEMNIELIAPSRSHCKCMKLDPYFYQLTNTIAELQKKLCADYSVSESSLTDWNIPSSNSKDDCGFLSNLYQILSDKIRNVCTHYVSLCEKNQTYTPTDFSLFSMHQNVSDLADTLQMLLDFSESEFNQNRVICKSCDNRVILNSLNDIWNTLDQTSHQIQTLYAIQKTQRNEQNIHVNSELCANLLDPLNSTELITNLVNSTNESWESIYQASQVIIPH